MERQFLNSLEGFDWDEGNREKNAKHGVEWMGIEEVFFNPSVVVITDVDHSTEELRWKILGKTANSRLLIIVFTIRKQMIRPISARSMNKKERDFYEEEIKKNTKV